jgi:hypothetical protein
MPQIKVNMRCQFALYLLNWGFVRRNGPITNGLDRAQLSFCWGKLPSFTQNQTVSRSGGSQENERHSQANALVAATGDRYDSNRVPLAAWNGRT